MIKAQHLHWNGSTIRPAIFCKDMNTERKKQVRLYAMIKGLPTAILRLLPDGVLIIGAAQNLYGQKMSGKKRFSLLETEWARQGRLSLPSSPSGTGHQSFGAPLNRSVSLFCRGVLIGKGRPSLFCSLAMIRAN